MNEQSHDADGGRSGVGPRDGDMRQGDGMDSSGGTGGMGESGAGYGGHGGGDGEAEQVAGDQSVQRSETIEAEDIEFEADDDMIDDDDGREVSEEPR